MVDGGLMLLVGCGQSLRSLCSIGRNGALVGIDVPSTMGRCRALNSTNSAFYDPGSRRRIARRSRGSSHSWRLHRAHCIALTLNGETGDEALGWGRRPLGVSVESRCLSATSASVLRMSLAMTVEERQAFLAQVHVAIVAVDGEDGRGPLAGPIWYDYRPRREVSP